jgi:class 3 adenylate cyclase
MHRDLKALLHDAVGESRFAMVVFLDVRGFSSFAKLAESSETAVFLTTVYTKILDDFFPDASFFKPTGDGLLIVLDYDRDSMKEVVTKAVETSLQLVEAFATLTKDDPMVNFDVPGKIGIGLARGAATRLVSGGKTLDYSGRPLNLAARLMNVARPAGVVFDPSLDLDLLPTPIARRFASEQVYIRGLADDVPMAVYVQKGVTTVEDFYKRPTTRRDRHVLHCGETPFKELMMRGDFMHPVDREPADGASPRVYLQVPAVVNGRKQRGVTETFDFPAVFYMQGGEHFARMDYDKKAIAQLTKAGVKSTWPVKTWVEYDCLPEG